MFAVNRPLSLAQAGPVGGLGGLGEVLLGVAGAGVVTLPVAIGACLCLTRTGRLPGRWYDPVLGMLGRVPSLLLTLVLGTLALASGLASGPLVWGVAAMVAGLPFVWRIAGSALAELPRSLLETAGGLGLGRRRILALVGWRVLAPALCGAVLLALSRALLEGWILWRLAEGAGWPGALPVVVLVAVVSVSTLISTWLLGHGRQNSRDLEFMS